MIADESGTLGVVEDIGGEPISFERFYFFASLQPGARRGGHAHKKLRQVFVVFRGSVKIDIKSSTESYSFHLISNDQALVLPAGYWRDLYDFSPDALVGVIASDKFDEADYIRDWDAFVDWDRAQRHTDIPYLDLSRYSSIIGTRVINAISEVVSSGPLIGGPEVERFEAAFAAYCGVSDAVGIGNGLQALTLALRAADIGEGREVILPANTFIATALAVIEAGAKPVLVDVEETTGLIDMTAVEMAINDSTGAIIPVHLYGHPCDMDRLSEIVGTRPILILEDAAQAHGALYKGRRCGALGHAAAFSFYPTKNLGAVGDAGCVTTNDPALAARIRLLGNYGTRRKYEHLEIGTNSRLDPVQAAALNVKLPYLENFNARRVEHADIYLRRLQNLPGLSLPHVHEWARPVWHVFPVRVAADIRQDFLSYLASNGIGTNIHYPTPIHLQPCFSSMGLGQGSFPISEKLSEQLVSLPLDATHTTAEIERVVEVVRTFCLGVRRSESGPLVLTM